MDELSIEEIPEVFSGAKIRANVLHIKPGIKTFGLAKALGRVLEKNMEKENVSIKFHVLDKVEKGNQFVLLWHLDSEYCSNCLKEQEELVE